MARKIMLIEIPHFEWELDVTFDVLDAAIHRWISKMVNGFVDFIREEPTKATIIYNLSQYQIGAFGKIRIDKLGVEKSIISLFEIKKPFSDRSKHYKDFVEALLNRLNQENIFLNEPKDRTHSLSIGKNVNDSIIINGDNNTVNFPDKKS